MLDAYTVRKAVPRILLAAIGINISIYLCVAMVDITTILGKGIGDILITGFQADEGVQFADGVSAETNGGNLVLGTAVLATVVLLLFNAATLGPAIIGALGSILLVIALIALAVLFTLLIRQALIIFLTVVSPVAIACFVLPGTEKYFKKWLDLFIKTLMVYPIIAIMFAMSTVMGTIFLRDAATSTGFEPLSGLAVMQGLNQFGQGAANGGDTEQAIKLIAALVVIYAPLVLIPFAFKLAGGAISAVFNAAQGTTDRKRRGLAEGRAKRMGEAKAIRKDKFRRGELLEGKRWIPGSQRFARGINRVGLGYGTGLRGRYGVGSHGRSAMQNSMEESIAKTMQSSEFKKISNVEDALRAGTYRTESEALAGMTEHYLSTQGRRAGESDQDFQSRAQRSAQHSVSQFKTSGLRFGSQATMQAAARQMVITGNGFSDIGDMTRVLARTSLGNADSAAAQAGFANATTKQVGRWDLAPGFGNLNNLVQAQAGTGQQSEEFVRLNGTGAPTQAAFDRETVRAIRESTDPGNLARTSKPHVFRNLNQVADRASARGDAETVDTIVGLITEAESNRYSTAGSVTDSIDEWSGPEAGQPRLYQGNNDPRDPRLRRPDEPTRPPGGGAPE